MNLESGETQRYVLRWRCETHEGPFRGLSHVGYDRRRRSMSVAQERAGQKSYIRLTPFLRVLLASLAVHLQTPVRCNRVFRLVLVIVKSGEAQRFIWRRRCKTYEGFLRSVSLVGGGRRRRSINMAQEGAGRNTNTTHISPA